MDDAWLHNPKVRKAGLFGRALYIAAICYSHRQNTDGSIDADVIDLLATEAGLTMEQANEAASRLLEVELFEREASGWHVHDYEACQATKAERDAIRESARERQRRSRARNDDVTCDSHVSHSEVTPREVEVEVEVEEREGAQAAPPAPKKSSPRKRGVPDDFQPDADRLKWAEINTPGVDLRRETEKFVEWHQAKGNTFVDHQKAWQNWMRRATPSPRGAAQGSPTAAARARLAAREAQGSLR